jgi:hypothetical protein
LPCMIGFERRINMRGEVGTITVFARFASKHKNHRLTYLSIDGYTKRLWGMNKDWLGLHLPLPSMSGLTSGQSMNRGPPCTTKRFWIEKQWPSSPCLTSWTIWNERNARV